jgi:hypothetical protein
MPSEKRELRKTAMIRQQPSTTGAARPGDAHRGMNGDARDAPTRDG